ncbi:MULTISPECIES: septum site-determining protein Ssd [Amycolatopsis]|uniref:Helicase/secretion neighborhood CpaE-like protein n=2 Tax=Amycolatopsis TaxID=1813 RepID=A0A1I4CBN0_9PSEU|nr:septum site-determining protein Ssd [Amycolatopsis sacchari]SFK78030.1 helicase/secretion neighborhood CpaE-like protein [Amycolatopsis sacchari]
MTDVRPLVIVSDEALLDEVLRLAAAVGCAVERAPDLASAGAAWARAPLVLIDEEVVEGEVGLPPRAKVFLVTKGEPSKSTWASAFAAGVEEVLSLPDAEPVLVGALADVAEGPGVPGGCVVGVIGGRGGAGASVFASALGMAAGQDGALLVDCDQLGGGLDLVLAADAAEGARWPALCFDGGRVPIEALRSALPEHRHRLGRFPFVSCDRKGDGPTSQAVASVVDAGRRAGMAVVCDLPRHLNAAGRAAVQRADLIALVVPAEVRACAAARRVVEGLGVDKVRLVVRGPAPDGLMPQDAAEHIGIPLLTSMAPERYLDRHLERGEFVPRPRSPLITAARIVLAAARQWARPHEVAA